MVVITITVTYLAVVFVVSHDQLTIGIGIQGQFFATSTFMVVI